MAYRITKTVTKETQSLRARIEIHEGDANAPVPGGYYGSITLSDDDGNMVERRALGPEDLDPIAQTLLGLKDQALTDAGAVLITDAKELESAPEDIESEALLDR
jgi:hypothetical protein